MWCRTSRTLALHNWVLSDVQVLSPYEQISIKVFVSVCFSPNLADTRMQQLPGLPTLFGMSYIFAARCTVDMYNVKTWKSDVAPRCGLNACVARNFWVPGYSAPCALHCVLMWIHVSCARWCSLLGGGGGVVVPCPVFYEVQHVTHHETGLRCMSNVRCLVCNVGMSRRNWCPSVADSHWSIVRAVPKGVGNWFIEVLHEVSLSLSPPEIRLSGNMFFVFHVTILRMHLLTSHAYYFSVDTRSKLINGWRVFVFRM